MPVFTPPLPLLPYNYKDNTNPVFECIKVKAAQAGVTYRDPFQLGKFGFVAGGSGPVNVVRSFHVVEGRDALVASALILKGMNKATYLTASIGKTTWTDDFPTPAQLFQLPEKDVWYVELERACQFLDNVAPQPGPPIAAGFQAFTKTFAQTCLNLGRGWLDIKNNAIQNPAELLNRLPMTIDFVVGSNAHEVTHVFMPSLGGTIFPGPLTILGLNAHFRGCFLFQTFLVGFVRNGVSFTYTPDFPGWPGTLDFSYRPDRLVKQVSNGQTVPCPLINAFQNGPNFVTFQFSIGIRPLLQIARTPTEFAQHPITQVVPIEGDTNALDDNFAPHPTFTANIYYRAKGGGVTFTLNVAAARDGQFGVCDSCGFGTIEPPPAGGFFEGLEIVFISRPAIILKCTQLSANFTVYIQNKSNTNAQIRNVKLLFSVLPNAGGPIDLIFEQPLVNLTPVGVPAKSVIYVNIPVVINSKAFMNINAMSGQITGSFEVNTAVNQWTPKNPAGPDTRAVDSILRLYDYDSSCGRPVLIKSYVSGIPDDTGTILSLARGAIFPLRVDIVNTTPAQPDLVPRPANANQSNSPGTASQSPLITNVGPIGLSLTGGEPFIIRGTNFLPTKGSVSIGGQAIPASNIVAWADNSITLDTPPFNGNARLADVLVQTSANGSAQAFDVVALLSPITGDISGNMFIVDNDSILNPLVFTQTQIAGRTRKAPAGATTSIFPVGIAPGVPADPNPFLIRPDAAFGIHRIDITYSFTYKTDTQSKSATIQTYYWVMVVP